jgi:hypothetical protein
VRSPCEGGIEPVSLFDPTQGWTTNNSLVSRTEPFLQGSSRPLSRLQPPEDRVVSTEGGASEAIGDAGSSRGLGSPR